jgi:hypothetical protein
VDADGGTGNDALIIVGTTTDDKFVVGDGRIYGGGLSVQFRNMESLVLDGREGDDTISVLSTSPGLQTKLYGNRGSDTFLVGPQTIDRVMSKNIQGHRYVDSSGILHDDMLSDGDHAGSQ